MDSECTICDKRATEIFVGSEKNSDDDSGGNAIPRPAFFIPVCSRCYKQLTREMAALKILVDFNEKWWYNNGK